MKTYTTKIAKNGATLYYSVETGKRIAKEIALEIERKEIIANGTVKERYELAKETTETKSEEDTEMKNQNTNAVSTPAIPYEVFMTLVTGKNAEQRAAKLAEEQRQRDIDEYKYNIRITEYKIASVASNLHYINDECEKYPTDESLKAYAAELTEEVASLQTELTDTKIKLAKLTHEADIEDYAVSTEAQDAAIEAEIEPATATSEEIAETEEDTEMKNQNTNAVSTPAIETRIASNGAVSVYVNGKRTSREEAVEIAEQNDLPTYTATCYPYSERNYCINKDFATALSAYKWMEREADKNLNVADGSFKIKRYTPRFENGKKIYEETKIYEYDDLGEEIDADDEHEPEFAKFIYAKNGESLISQGYERMMRFHDQLIGEGLTEEQINQVLVTQYNDANGREHCNLIKEFKAQNAAKAEANVEDYAVSTEAQDAAIEAETISTDERIAEIENEIAPLVEEMKVVATGLQMFKEYPDEYTQEFIDERENLYDSLSRKYRKLVGELESLQKTPPENPKPETPNETHAEPEEITFIAQNGASLTIEGGMPTIAANGNRLEVNGIWLGDYYTNEDAQEAAEALKIDVEEFGDDHPVLNKEYFAEIEFEESPTGGDRTAEHLNANAPEGWTVTRADKKINVDYHGKRVAEVDRITERDLLVPHAFFRQFTPLVDKSKTPEQIFLDDRYRELAELEERREELQHTSPISKERLKTLDDMINQVKRDIYETEMDNPDTVASFCKAGAIDEDGNVWF